MCYCCFSQEDYKLPTDSMVNRMGKVDFGVRKIWVGVLHLLAVCLHLSKPWFLY